MIATASTPLRPSIGYLHCRAAARHAAKICENLRNLRIENAFFAPSREEKIPWERRRPGGIDSRLRAFA